VLRGSDAEQRGQEERGWSCLDLELSNDKYTSLELLLHVVE